MGLEIATIATIAGAAAGVGGTAFSVVQGRAANKEQRKTRRLQEQRQQLEERRRVRRNIREQRIARAQALNVAGQVGAQDSSAVQGGVGSLSSQLGSNLGFGSRQAQFNQLISTSSQRAADLQSSANLGAGIGSFGLNLFNSAGGFKQLDKAFG